MPQSKWMRAAVIQAMLVGCLTALPALFTASQAATQVPITCGMVATTDAELTADLACAGTAVTIGSDAIEIDLKGHTLTVTEGDAVVNYGHDYVTVRYGGIRGGGIVIGGGAAYNTLASLDLVGSGIRLQQSDKAFIYRNTLSGEGIALENTATRHLLMSNRLDHAGIVIDGYDIALRDNTLEHGDIVNIEGGRIAVIGNRLRYGRIAMQNAESGDVIVMDNKVYASPSDGISVSAWQAAATAPSRIVRNEVTDSARHGILVDSPEAPNALLANNYASHNGAAGIHAPDSLDLGLNRAQDNAGAQQCVGVSCEGARARPVTCGMLATTDVFLPADLSCAGTAIIAGADGIEIDLKGHTLSVTGGWAVYNQGRDHVTVRNGRIIGGDIWLEDDAAHNTLTSLEMIDAGITLEDGDLGFIFRNALTNGRILITSGNDSMDNLIFSNRMSSGNIDISGVRNTVLNNTLQAGDIFNDEGHHTAVIGNRVTDGAIRLDDSCTETVVIGNKVVGSPRDGIHLTCSQSPVVRNEVSYSAGHGIEILNGIDVPCGAVLSANYASHNDGCGIHAPGATDGGANRAKDNAGFPQCVGVFCP